ncbi:54S ribosomal protein L35, mitochondrial [Rhizoctonia solani]|uniref:54S ribosomal protein L35, mitochondrial n=1 Tax=Rhizoctonia solani TaxID=456999 RepID=A0A0K6GGN2_9AGAM|nr:54S ribosomal protein L35, mitochondrial [Rhizoctonia solani]
MQAAWRRSTRIANVSRCMSGTAYQRPLPPGKLLVYDLAVELLEKDSAEKKALLAKETDPSTRKKLEILSDINLPEVRWNFAQGRYDLTQPVYRHLLEQDWRQKGTLDLLMERVHQMKVIPDVLAFFHPTVDLRVSFSGEDVIPGIFLPVKSTLRAPSITAQAYHPEERLYTLLMVDPDVPDPSTKSFSTYLHAFQPNIPLSATNTQITLPMAPETSETSLPYIPPHPQNGTSYHRYTTLLLPQSSELSIDALKLSRERFNVREAYKQYGFARGGGIHMFRENWDETVGSVYKNFLGQPEPKFGKTPKPQLYLDDTGKRYRKYTTA